MPPFTVLLKLSIVSIIIWTVSGCGSPYYWFQRKADKAIDNYYILKYFETTLERDCSDLVSGNPEDHAMCKQLLSHPAVLESIKYEKDVQLKGLDGRTEIRCKNSKHEMECEVKDPDSNSIVRVVHNRYPSYSDRFSLLLAYENLKSCHATSYFVHCDNPNLYSKFNWDDEGCRERFAKE